jgi:hypothetical protein
VHVVERLQETSLQVALVSVNLNRDSGISFALPLYSAPNAAYSWTRTIVPLVLLTTQGVPRWSRW